MNNDQHKQTLLDVLREQKAMKMKGSIYHKTQIDLTYNSNHIEGSRLTHEQTRYIFETNTVGVTADEAVNVNDIVETVNHFCCIDLIIDKAEESLTEELIKQLHGILKTGTSNSRKEWFAVGDYKRLPNEVGGEQTHEPEQVEVSMQRLLEWYNTKPQHTLPSVLSVAMSSQPSWSGIILSRSTRWRTSSTCTSASRKFTRSRTATAVWGSHHVQGVPARRHRTVYHHR